MRGTTLPYITFPCCLTCCFYAPVKRVTHFEGSPDSLLLRPKATAARRFEPSLIKRSEVLQIAVKSLNSSENFAELSLDTTVTPSSEASQSEPLSKFLIDEAGNVMDPLIGSARNRFPRSSRAWSYALMAYGLPIVIISRFNF